jgi:hypothetical protein
MTAQAGPFYVPCTLDYDQVTGRILSVRPNRVWLDKCRVREEKHPDNPKLVDHRLETPEMDYAAEGR